MWNRLSGAWYGWPDCPTIHLVALLLAFALIASIGMVLARNGPSARSGLTSVEDRVLYELRKRVIALRAGDRQNPRAGRWRDAVHTFEEECAVCHGPAGRGDGMLGSLMFPRAPNLTGGRTQSLSDAELHHIIGREPVYRHAGHEGHDSEDEIWQLVALVRQLPRLSADQMKEAGAGHSDDSGHSHEIKR